MQVVDDVLVERCHVGRRDRPREESPREPGHVGQVELPGRFPDSVFAIGVEPEHDEIIHLDDRVTGHAVARIFAELRGPASRHAVLKFVSVIRTFDPAALHRPERRKEAVHVCTGVRVNHRLSLAVAVRDEVQTVELLVNDLALREISRWHEHVPAREVARELPVSALVVAS